MEGDKAGIRSPETREGGQKGVDHNLFLQKPSACGRSTQLQALGQGQLARKAPDVQTVDAASPRTTYQSRVGPQSGQQEEGALVWDPIPLPSLLYTACTHPQQISRSNGPRTLTWDRTLELSFGWVQR